MMLYYMPIRQLAKHIRILAIAVQLITYTSPRAGGDSLSEIFYVFDAPRQTSDRNAMVSDNVQSLSCTSP